VRILIAGLGSIGQRHARNLRALRGAGVELHAWRRRGDRAVITDAAIRDPTRDVHAELRITPHASLDAALATRPDAAFVCTPTAYHQEVAQRAAEAGCHLFIEKPVAASMQGVDRLREAVAARGLVAMVGCQWRFHPLVAQLRDTLVRGLLGSVRDAAIDYAEYLPDWHPWEDYRKSYAARRALGGGVILTQIHDYDLAYHLFGPARACRASGGRLSALEIDVEDTVDAQLQCAAVVVRVRQSFAERPPRRTVTVRGERGDAALDLLDATLRYTPALAPDASLTDYERNRMFLDEVAHFLACIERGEKPVVPLEEGIAVLRIALTVRQSLETGLGWTRVEGIAS
jgi:predicted dehydrogenase